MLPFASAAQEHRAVAYRGAPLMRYYTPEEYDASDQNWAAVQDVNGTMLFGTTDRGVLLYDGVRFRTIPLKTSQFVRSMVASERGVVYIGSVGDFGRLVPLRNGELRYESLVETIQDSVPNFQDIHRVYAYGQFVFFCDKREFFIYNEVTGRTVVQKIPSAQSFLACQVGDELVMGVGRDSLLFYGNGQFRRVKINPSPAFLQRPKGNLSMYGAVKVDDNLLLLAYSPGGLFFYDTQTSSIVDFPGEFAPHVMELIDQGALIYNMHMLRNGNIGLGLIFSEDAGYYEITLEGKEVESLRVSRGLGNAFVTDFTESRDGSLWLTHNVGISSVEQQSSFRHYTVHDGVNDVIISLYESKGDMYFGTMSGLQRLSGRDGYTAVHTVEGISSAVWKSITYRCPYSGERFLISQSQTSIYEVRGDRARPLEVYRRDERTGRLKMVLEGEGVRGGGYSLAVSPWDSAVVYLGANVGLKGIRRMPDGRWMEEPIPIDVRAEIRGFSTDAKHRMWLTAYTGGVYMLRRDADGKMILRHIAERQGLGNPNQTFACVVDGTAYLCTSDGVYTYDEAKDTVVASALPLRKGLGFSNLMSVEAGAICQRYSHREDTVYMEYYPSLASPSAVDSAKGNPLLRLPHRWIDDWLYTGDSMLWFAYGNELYSCDMRKWTQVPARARAYVSRVRTLRGDSILFGGTYYRQGADGRIVVLQGQPKEMEPKLPYSLNGLVFSFGTDAFVGNDVAEFQFFLEHNDKEWSKWVRNGEAQYMNLSEGSYVLRVRTRDAYGRVSPVTEYRFSIAPPFYRTWWAYASYVIITGLLLYLGLWWNSRRLIAEQRRLSKIVEERTKEVVAQKEQIEKQKEEIESSIEYASRIQQAMLPRQELMDRLFPEHFMLYLPRDVVSGDFYWMTHIGRKKVCCIADCTGHGVPGGFMSMLGSSLLHQVTRDKQNDLDTAEILNRVRELLISSLHQSTSEKSNKDGMDLVLFIVDEDTNELQYSGAHNPLVIVRNGEATVLKADKMPVGIYTRTASSFASEKFQLEEGDMVYAYSDGYQDQFGGPKKMKFMSKNLRAFLAKISNLPMEEQREALYENFITWMGDSNPRLDDVVIFGMRVVPWGKADDEE